MNLEHPHIFGIRHLSPAGAWHLKQFLSEKNPRLVLVEGPCDFDDTLQWFSDPAVMPPIAVLAYTKEAPVRTILYPFAEYSPEYQAILWAHEHGRECRFMDLPSEVFLALPEHAPGGKAADDGEEERMNVYAHLDRQAGEDGHETFWERTMEHTDETQAYHKGAQIFGSELRALEEDGGEDRPEILVREAFMRRKIQEAVEEGFAPEEIVVVTGSYHVAGLLDGQAGPMTDEELASLPRLASSHTLMPYSYYRLSTRAGYGAGNKAPAYYALLWEGIGQDDLSYTARSYLSRIAGFQREHGNPVSSAQVTEAVQLAAALAKLRGGSGIPALRDLRDAAVTCLGGGSFSEITLAMADTEIGTAIGSLPDGVSRTSIQEDFYRKLKELKLEKYRDITQQELALDLRENRNVSTKAAAFLDLHRSFFLHRLRVMGVSFAKQATVRQDNATWAERWSLRWTPEAEIELVEAALRGDTIAQAASFSMKERVEQAPNMSQAAQVIEDAFSCGMAQAAAYATAALQAMAVDAASVVELAAVTQRLSVILQYGDIRQLDSEPLKPILQQVFFRACLILPGECVCDDEAAKAIAEAIEQLNSAALAHDFLDAAAWNGALREVAERDDLNTKLSGFCMAIRLERGLADGETLRLEVQRRLSRGVPAQLGAGWFEGIAMKNRYALIARLSLWESLDEYLNGLDEEEFKRALIFLRRAFADFTSMEKDAIAENLGEIWGFDGQQVSEALNAQLDETDGKELVENLEDFDFDF